MPGGEPCWSGQESRDIMRGELAIPRWHLRKNGVIRMSDPQPLSSTVWHRSGHSLLSIVAGTLLAVAPALFAAGPIRAEEIPTLRMPPLRLVVTRQSTRQTAVVAQTISIDGAIRQFFPEEPIEWNPAGNLDSAVLVCQATGEKLPIGENDRASLFLAWTKSRLRKNERSELKLCASDPASLRPGVYRGTLWTWMCNAGEGPKRPVKATWDIAVVVCGRWLAGVEFQRTVLGKPLRVGAPASLVVRVVTVGCELGRGSLRLDWWSPLEKPQRALYLDLPLERPIDPLVAFGEIAGQGCHYQWRDCAVWTQVEEAAEPGGSRPPEEAQRCHRIAVVAPHCFLPGTMQAEVDWQQAEIAANRQEALRKATSQEPVLPGILVFPTPAFVHEPLTVLVRTDAALGPTLSLTASEPDGKTSVLDLRRQRLVALGGGDQLCEHSVRFHPRVPGEHRIAWRDGDVALGDRLGEPAVFSVYFMAETKLVEGIKVFASAPPPLYGDAVGWKAVRREACRFWYAPGLLRDAKLENLATFRGRLSGPLVRHDPETEPILRFGVDDGRNAKVDALRSTETGAADPKPAEPAWTLASAADLSPWIAASVDLDRNAPSDHPRHRTGEYEFVQRMILHAVDQEGQRLERIVSVPFSVRVSTDRQYYLWYSLVVGALVVPALFFVIMARRNRVPKRRALAADVFAKPRSVAEEDPFSAAEEAVFLPPGPQGAAEDHPPQPSPPPLAASPQKEPDPAAPLDLGVFGDDS